MWHRYIVLQPQSGLTLQAQVRSGIIKAILDGRVSTDKPLPSPRKLATELAIARTTVVLAYQRLVDEQIIEARERRGYFINPEALDGRRLKIRDDSLSPGAPPGESADHRERLTSAKSGKAIGQSPAGANPDKQSSGPVPVLSVIGQRNIVRPRNWRTFDYPFIYGKIDSSLFPVNNWREASRMALRRDAIERWSDDSVDDDDELLVEQILTNVLPRRGVWANSDEVLITVGAQNGLYLIAQLLMNADTVVGIEDPCYADARNMFSVFTTKLIHLPVGKQGIHIDMRLNDCHVLYVTPSHQCPTTTTLPLDKRQALLEKASLHGITVIEDDYECELNFTGSPAPALKSLDEDNRVIYVGSLSKTLAPGLRVGFIVGPAPFIAEARALRRLMYRHPPTNNQRTVAHFLALGHYDANQLRIATALKRRWQAMEAALSAHESLSARTPTFGGSSFWVELPEHIPARELEKRALAQGIIISAGDTWFAEADAHTNYCRLGFSSIEESRITPGINRLAALINMID